LLTNRKYVFVLFVILIGLLGSAQLFAQINNETQEVPLVLLKLNEIRDFPVNNFRNFIVTNPSILSVENLPGNVLRITANRTGKTFVYIWDADGRKTLQFEVTGAAPNIVENFRPGYNPQGNEYIYRTTSNFQRANGQWLDPIWNHDFSSSVTLDSQRYWRTFLRGTTNAIGLEDSQSYTPFSSATVPNQMLTYYESPSTTVALGDVNYDPGRLSLNGFPLRGGLFQLNHPKRRDQFQLFGGAARNLTRENYFFSQPKEYLYGVSGTKELWPNIIAQGSFIYLDQPEEAGTFFNPNPENDFVGDLTLIARPLNHDFTLEGEYARSSDGQAYRGLVEYAPYWGRILLSHRDISKNYITPTSFFLLQDLEETSVIADVYATDASTWNVNYQRSVFGSNDVNLDNTTTNHRITASNLYKLSKEKSIITGATSSFGNAQNSRQNQQRAFVTYQKLDQQTKDFLYAQAFLEHSYIDLSFQNVRRFGVGYDTRATLNRSRGFSYNLQHTFRVQQLRKEQTSADTNEINYEYSILLGPTVMWERGKHTASLGALNNLIFQDTFDNWSNLLQTFASYYYNANTALQVGVRSQYNVDPGLDYSYASVLGEFVYRFGSKVPDTLLSAFQSSGTLEGVVFLDQNDDGRFQPNEPLVPYPAIVLNRQKAVEAINGDFRYKVDAGENQVMVHLPNAYQDYQFTTTNPQVVDVYPGERKTVFFGINRRLIIQGRVQLIQESTTDKLGFKNAVVEIKGDRSSKTVTTTRTGLFNTYVTEPGTYTATVLTSELPSGYKSTPSSSIEFTVKQDEVTKLQPMQILAKRRVFGFAFVDENQNRRMDPNEKVLSGIEVHIGKYTTVTDQDGSFAFDGLPAGAHALSVTPQTVQGRHVNLAESEIVLPMAGRVDLPLAYQ
jgi:hypothetical protein